MVSQSAAGLLLDPGLGKTSCTLSTFKILKEAGFVNRMLVIAPLRPVYHVWPAEIDKWSNFENIVYSILHGKDKEWAVDNLEGVDVLMINPEGLAWLWKKYGKNTAKKLGVDMLVIDESTKFKHSNTSRFKMLKNMLPLFQRRYILTGTVSPNGLLDLFGQFYLLDFGNALGAYITHYRNKYFSQPNPMHEPYKYEPRPTAMEEIAERIKPLSLSLKAEDYLDMPERQYINIEIDMPEKAMPTYLEVQEEFLAQIEDTMVIAENAAVAGTKCRQIANGAVYTIDKEYRVIHDVKIEALSGLIEELSGAPLLIMYEYRHDLDRILKKYPKMWHFGMKGISDIAIIKRWNAGELPYLAGHPASMGHGLNLQGACSRICWFGITWNYEFYDQAIARIYRQGQESSVVLIYHIIAKNTLDKKVLKVLQSKEATQNKLLDYLKS